MMVALVCPSGAPCGEPCVSRRRASRSSLSTRPDCVGLPDKSHGLWLQGHEAMRTALAVCDAFAALNIRGTDSD